MNYKTATVFGGTGFIGTQVVRELAKKGVTVKVATRVPERAYFLRTCGVVGQIVPFPCDYGDAESVAQAVKGSDFVVNCIGILYERYRKQFEKIHTDLPALIAASCAKQGAERFVHISSLGAERSHSKYAKTKLAGEQAVLKNFPHVTILRPSVVFGEDDEFFNMFAKMAQILPALPLIGGGHTKFQPVFVGDVADAVMAAFCRPALGQDNPQGKIYELGGPDILSLKEVYETLFEYTGLHPALISVPFGLAKLQASVLSLLPKPLLTRDQVESLKTDNVVSETALTLSDLGISPQALDLILPHYLELYRPGGRFANSKAA